MAQPTQRLLRRIVEDFEQADVHHVTRALADLPGLPGPMTTERVQAAVVLLSEGDLARFEGRLQAARTDWRDVLVAAGLADEDWPRRLDEYLDPNGAR